MERILDSVSPVRIFIHYLHNLPAILERAKHFEIESGSLLQAKLVPDMFPFAQQVSTAVSFSLRAVSPFLKEVPPDCGPAQSYIELKDLICRTTGFLQNIDADAFDEFEKKSVNTRAVFNNLELTGADYFRLYAQSNFMFHFSIAYATLRVNGVPLGKQKFDGFHAYPDGFSFLGQ